MDKIQKEPMIKQERGITLIALIITIIVLLILAGVSIAMLTGENGILNKAQTVSLAQAEAELKETMNLSIAESYMKMDEDHTIEAVLTIATNNGYISTTEGYTITKTTSESGLVTECTITHTGTGATVILTQTISGGSISLSTGEATTEPETSTTPEISIPSSQGEVQILSEKTTIEDEKGNKVVVPGGFGISADSGVNLTEGIVIEDSKGNQFTWVPIGENLVKADGTTATVKLGRYETFELNEEPKDLATAVTYGSYTYVEETKENTQNLGNTIATDIEAFMSEAQSNGGFYIGRYEAGTVDSDGKITLKASSSAVVSQTQLVAAAAAKSMYGNEAQVESDLINSVAWDTAIMYIQKFSTNSDAETYASRTGNTDSSNDNYCNIWNMSSGVYEWSTETSSSSGSPCAYRGGRSSYSNPTSSRGSYSVTNSSSSIGSRPLLVGLDTTAN